MADKRSNTIVRCGLLFILVNFLLAALNFFVGIFTNSLTIASDGIHSLVDSVSGLIVIVTEHIAASKKYSEMRERIEQIATIIIALIIIAGGAHIVIESIGGIIANLDHPHHTEYSVTTIMVVIICVFVKYGLAVYLNKKGTEIKSKVIKASGAETYGDCLISFVVLFSAGLSFVGESRMEPYVSLIIALIIIKSGLEFIFPCLSHHHHHHLEKSQEHGFKSHSQ